MTTHGKLFLIPCPLAEGTTTEVLPSSLSEIILSIEYFLVENERSARRFISSLKLGILIENLKFNVLDKDTLQESIEPIVKLCLAGHSVGVISEAGCPAIADPGAMAVNLAHRFGIEVVPLVGPSSILLALMGSGMNGQSFAFHGYLPIEKVERAKQIKLLEKDATQKKQSQIFIETPYRNQSLVADLIANLSPNTKLCIACDLTASTQFLKTLYVREWKQNSPDLNKRPTVFIIM